MVIMLEAVCDGFVLLFFTFSMHIIVGRLFRKIHPSLQYSARPFIHAFLYDLFPPHVHPALCLFPLVTVCTVFVFRLFTIHISEPELILKYHGQWKEGVGVFVYIYTHVILITKTCVTGALRTRTRLLLHR